MKPKFIYNPKTHTLHIEGYCPWAKRSADYLVFDTEDDAIAYDGRAVGMCKSCQRKREENLKKEK